jgi:beta-lactamase regulating signal transducer with metallopeptidase domain
MTDFGILLVWSAVQITIVAGVAAVVYLCAVRRGLGSAVPSWSLGIVLVLSLVSMFPLPAWWSWRPMPISHPSQTKEIAESISPSPENSPADKPAVSKNALTEGSEGLAVSAEFFGRIWHNMENATAFPSNLQRKWLDWLALVFLMGAGFCMVRFMLGLWGIHRLRRRSRSLDDPVLKRRVERLMAQMDCRSEVEIHETGELTSAATVGWRRPCVLLPLDWRRWSDPELQAVLAHELAHICRSDYVFGLMARVCVAWYFYHPLVRWLANGMQLQQELAADALGARFAGGRAVYIRALAQIALHQDGKSIAWPARAFLPARGTLMRRIRMLKMKERIPSRPALWMHRVLSAALLAAVALGVSPLRGPERILAREESGETSQAKPQAASETQKGKDREPFNLAYAPPDAIGLIAFRPAEILGQPGLKSHLDFINQEIAQLLKEHNLPLLSLRIEEIDQIMGGIYYQNDENAPEGTRNQIFGTISYVRTVKPFDWNKHFHTAFPDLTEVQHAGKVYHKTSKRSVFPLFPGCNCYYFPDDRSLVVETEEKIRRMLESKPSWHPSYVNSEMWKPVENNLLAMAFDNRNPQIANAAADSKDPEVGLFLRSNCQMVFGVDGPDIFRIRGFAKCASEEEGKKLVQQIQAMIQLAQAGLVQAKVKLKDVVMKKEQAAALQVSKDFLNQVKIRHQGTKVYFQSEVKAKMEDLIPTAYQKNN